MRPPTGLRFVLEAVLIVGAAVGTGVAQLGAPTIVGAVVGAWLLVSLFELANIRARRPARGAARAVPDSEAGETVEHVRVLTAAPSGGGPPEAAQAGAQPVDQPPGAPAAAGPAAAADLSTPWSWNVWNLDRIVREQGAGNDELQLLLLYLRDFANASGMLPPAFDGLVRESFGDLLVVPA